jgi:hypothetical protein
MPRSSAISRLTSRGCVVAEAGRLHGFSHLPGPGPASSKTRGPLAHIAVRSKACPSCQLAYGPLVMLDPRPGRPPAKPAPPTYMLTVTGGTGNRSQLLFDPGRFVIPHRTLLPWGLMRRP